MRDFAVAIGLVFAIEGMVMAGFAEQMRKRMEEAARQDPNTLRGVGLGAALVGRQLLYWWPDDGWQRGTVARLCPRPVFSHVVAYTRQTSALRGTADSLLDSASYGARWVLLSPAAAVGVRGRARPQP